MKDLSPGLYVHYSLEKTAAEKQAVLREFGLIVIIKQKAFTLIELMIVVTIVGILAGIAYPSYQDSVRKSRRADAKGALMGFANAMERYFTENNTYLGAAGTTGTPANTGAPRIL